MKVKNKLPLFNKYETYVNYNSLKLIREKVLLLAFCCAFTCCFTVLSADEKMPAVSPSPDALFFGSRIQRTMTLLETSSAIIRNQVKILFYGQSITAQSWWKLIKEDLEKRYPHAELIIENRSIGGFTAPVLVRCAPHDLYPFYPDLVLFHVYGGEKTGDLERIYSNIRRYTTAEIITYTHHVAHPKKAYTNPAFLKQRTISDDRTAKYVRYLAQKYNCELVEVRKEWKQYLQKNNISSKDLLGDGIHLNEKGKWLMAELVKRHFKFNPLTNNNWTQAIRTYEASRFVSEGVTDEITFTGKPWEKSKYCSITSKN